MVKSYLYALAAREACTIGELDISFREEEAVIAAPRSEIGIPLPADEDAVRGRIRTDEQGRYRPLSGARTLPGGWYTRCDHDDVERLVEVVYPLAITHARQAVDGTLRVVPLDEVLSRQSGRYSEVAGLSSRSRDLAADELCGRCVRAPLWRGQAPADAGIPCPEPCSVLVSLCREVRAWEREAPDRATPDPAVPFASFESPGNEVREACLRRLAGSAQNT